MKNIIKIIILTFCMSMMAQVTHQNTLSWSWSKGTGDAATGYHVQKSQVSGGPYTTIATITNIATTTFIDTNVVAGQTNYYVVTAFNTGGDSALSNQVTCVTPFQAPLAPTGLSGTTQ